MKPLLLAASLALPAPALGWGERGHHLIARSAALQILAGVELDSLDAQTKALYLGLRDHYRLKALELAHLANIPDTEWRSAGGAVKSLNAPTHFLDLEYWENGGVAAVPLDYPSALARDPRAFEHGTIVWRAEQLYERLVLELKGVARAKPGSKEARRHAAAATTYAGLLAHFVGDATMPLHTSSDHNGYGSGNGGLHDTFEGQAPLTATPALELAVYDRVPGMLERHSLEQRFRAGGFTPAARLVLDLALQSHKRIAELLALDNALVLERSSAEPGRRKRSAQRKSAEEAYKVFEPMLQEQLALASAALARLWRGAWEEAGRPDLSKSRSFFYQHRASFVEPDYDPKAVARIKAEQGRPSRNEDE